MIFYFSGTGNSYHMAKRLSEAQNERLVSIAGENGRKGNSFEYTLVKGETLGFVFPVYAWAPPRMVLDFVRRIKISTPEKPYTFSLCTCGDEEGLATPILKDVLAKRGLVLDSAFTVRMPNNYIISFDVDDKKTEAEKLYSSEQKLEKINAVVTARRKGVFDLIPGRLSVLKSLAVNPLFSRFAINTQKFHATDACIHCGLCVKVCPVHTIRLADKPKWGKQCTMCLACIHMCPVRAIQYGKATVLKGRYHHPDCEFHGV